MSWDKSKSSPDCRLLYKYLNRQIDLGMNQIRFDLSENPSSLTFRYGKTICKKRPQASLPEPEGVSAIRREIKLKIRLKTKQLE